MTSSKMLPAELDKEILLIEDDLDIRESLAEILRSESFAVTEARNGKEALDLLRSGASRPRLIILDLMMPVMDGIEFRQHQVQVPELASIPVLVVSADASAKAKAASMSVAGFLKKPIELEQLMETIEKLWVEA